MKFILSMAAILAGSGHAHAADAVELNGLSCLGQQKLGCFLLYQPAAPKPLNFTLAVGESKYGFKLVAVDPAEHQALVEKCGVKKYVHINATPDMIAPGSEPAGADASSMARTLGNRSTLSRSGATVANGEAGNLVGADIQSEPARGLALVAANNVNSPNGGQGSSADTGKGSSNNGETDNGAGESGGNRAVAGDSGVSSGGGSAGGTSVAVGTAQNGSANQMWYQESQSIEQSRVLTADEVINGQAVALPRTPLTPSDVNPQLVGSTAVFTDHIPNYKDAGSPNARGVND